MKKKKSYADVHTQFLSAGSCSTPLAFSFLTSLSVLPHAPNIIKSNCCNLNICQSQSLYNLWLQTAAGWLFPGNEKQTSSDQQSRSLCRRKQINFWSSCSPAGSFTRFSPNIWSRQEGFDSVSQGALSQYNKNPSWSLSVFLEKTGVLNSREV